MDEQLLRMHEQNGKMLRLRTESAQIASIESMCLLVACRDMLEAWVIVAVTFTVV